MTTLAQQAIAQSLKEEYGKNPTYENSAIDRQQFAPTNQTADDLQFGGSHYKSMSIQPWTAMEAWLTTEEFIGYLKGNIIKYIARANSGKEEHGVMIQKAEHYQQKLKETLSKHPEYHNSLVPDQSQFVQTR